MSKIENHSIFGHYSETENRVTAAFLQILKIGGTEFISNLISQIDDIEFPSSEINIITQEREVNNVYDGLLECNFSFRIMVESKTQPNKINKIQLDGIIKNANNPYDYIIFITPDNSKPLILSSNGHKIYWANWKKINCILQEINTKQEPLNFLIKEFEKFLDFLKLLDVVSPEQRVQIVAGSYGEPIALKYGFYACQNYRTIKESKYLAFYNNQGIHSLFEITEEPMNNCDLSQLNDNSVNDYLKIYEPNYNGDKRQFYRLRLMRNDLSIKHNGINKNGKRSAYTMGVFRYTTIEKLLKAKSTNDL